MSGDVLRVGLLVGGPSDERGISLNSGRSVADHLDQRGVSLHEILYFDRWSRPFSISRSLLYSNTPDDFDFKLSRTAAPLSRPQLYERLRGCDVVFPAMHGRFGEDGEVQGLLEEAGVPYVGSPPEACATAYDKFRAYATLSAAGVPTIPSVCFDGPAEPGHVEASLAALGEAPHGYVLKPAAGGSSFGVVTPKTAEAAVDGVAALVPRYGPVVAQPRVTGAEFTVVVIDGPDGAVALPPVEIETGGDVFSPRRKYLPTDDTHYHCPPRFPDHVVDEIRSRCEAVFELFGLRDFARIDGWATDDGRILISDLNPISGMEQNSFLFIQAGQAGMTHADVLRLILSRACGRAGVPMPAPGDDGRAAEKEKVAVLFGGSTTERQVSVLSGTNVWLKLLKSERYEPVPYLLDTDGDVWSLTYPVALRHTAEEIVHACHEAVTNDARRARLADDVVKRLHLPPEMLNAAGGIPRKIGRPEFLAAQSFVFIALHGGFGEDGTLQAELEAAGVAYNGSDPETSRLCMDKHETARRLQAHPRLGITTPKQLRLDFPSSIDREQAASLWERVTAACATPKVIVKPVADGCSTGIVPLASAGDLHEYVRRLAAREARVKGGVFSELADDQVVELPRTLPDALLFEEFVERDEVLVVDAPPPGGEADGREHSSARLAWGRETGWIEVTVGVLGHRGGMRALSPSVTIARKGVLSLEEKFMGGTGVNITPPPTPDLGKVAPSAIERTKALITEVADVLGIEGYARIDAFMQRDTGDVIVIEANTLPGLTPSTVLYHQALAEDPPLFPRDLLERIVELGMQRHRTASSIG